MHSNEYTAIKWNYVLDEWMKYIKVSCVNNLKNRKIIATKNSQRFKSVPSTSSLPLSLNLNVVAFGIIFARCLFARFFLFIIKCTHASGKSWRFYRQITK